jgi:hypothetical protein
MRLTCANHCRCAFSESTYATKFLVQGVSVAVEHLKVDGTIAALSEKYLSQEQPLADLPRCNFDTRRKPFLSLKYDSFPYVIVFVIMYFSSHISHVNLGIEIDRDAAAYVDRHPTYGLQRDDDRHYCMRDFFLFWSHQSQGSLGQAEGRKGSSIGGMMLSVCDTLHLL